ncbi:RNA polymerase-associated protein RapA [Morganella psychrotolerans]|uniref:RNA polymerase-associated protein RapA n=1 Tax=Morganella psychrotolerans TaxID=368603 RepID=A0A5M9R072_9GAMM|nr:RNA polymerase-associated protein RapA [Morganella psychrotolerans]KAA8713990.1 RNA polymerase-associated protein RapA [Morganella psychrotolerans]OBU03366.1 RNA polymerase-binding ATPase [Morganella psychrotolerans]
MPFTLGQRWISDTESELGLGTLVSVEARMITLLFPATGENRLYASADAPITRVMFNEGDTVTSHEGWQLSVTAVEENDGLLTYIGQRTDTGEENVCLREVFLDSKLTFSKPQDRLFAGQIDRMDRFSLRYRARKFLSEEYRRATSGLRGIRASLIPHQLFIANEVGKRHAPRVLLADEVGLGKTIEAGMIIHQQLMAGRAERILVVVPESLQYQWLVEMLRRFNLRFSLFDDSRYTEALNQSDNPFDTEQLVLCSLDFVRKSKPRFEHLCDAGWDMLVVDEAHHLVWHEESPSREYQVIETLAEITPSVLLLTATPEQLGMESHFARLRLLDPNRFHDFPAFVAEQQKYQPVADAVSVLLERAPLTKDQQNAIHDLIAEQDIEPLLKAANTDSEDGDNARKELTRMLMDRHGTSRLLFRNTRNGVKGFPRRELHAIKMPLPAQYQTAIKVAGIMGSKKTTEVKAREMLYPEQIYQEFEGENATWWNFDPRVEWLLGFLLANRNEKVLVICAQAATALQLEQVLREREGIHAAVFHENLSLLERDRAAAWFASEENGAQVLLCSEIGSEGRNFQFANQLVMFDLPFNPDLLEQRIGRLDRIGQKRDIQISIPYLEHTAQAVLLRWFHEGLDAFEYTCPTGRSIYDRYYDTLITMMANPTDLTGFDDFITECRKTHDVLKVQLEQGRDRLLEMHSNGGEAGNEIAAQIAAQDDDTELVTFALNLFDIVGINQDDRSDNMIALTPSDHMLVPDFPGLPEDGCTVTFKREQALSREDTQFISWEHPIIRNGLDLILSGDTGSCAVSVLKNKALPVGTLLTELIYVVEAQAPKNLQLTRFLPPTPVRLLMDAKGNNLAAQVEFESFNRQLNAVNRHTGSKFVNAVQSDVHQVLRQSEDVIAGQARECIDAAKVLADQHLTLEHNRLLALKSVNPNIRDDEVDAIEEERQQILSHLDEANWRLDAIRLIVVSHQ